MSECQVRDGHWPDKRQQEVGGMSGMKYQFALSTIIQSAEKLERARRFERPTPTLARLCSTPELRPLGGCDMGIVNSR